jgi:REP element-mobilizing transposase RayT
LANVTLKQCPIKYKRNQLGFRFRTWGGKRRGAGRKRTTERSRVSHKRREAFERRHPVHVTVRMRRETCHLRQSVCFRVLRRGFNAANGRDDFQLIHYSVQGNHVHFLVEADDSRSLSRGMRGLNVRIARALNRLIGRRGKVLDDRFHAVVLRTPTQTAHAIHYVLHNRQHHAPERYPSGWRDPFASAAAPLAEARTWLVRTGAPARLAACERDAFRGSH